MLPSPDRHISATPQRESGATSLNPTGATYVISEDDNRDDIPEDPPTPIPAASSEAHTTPIPAASSDSPCGAPPQLWVDVLSGNRNPANGLAMEYVAPKRVNDEIEVEIDVTDIESEGPYTIRNMPMLLRDWKPDFSLKRDMLRTLPIWVKLPQLPLYLWGVKSLSKIGLATEHHHQRQ
jgi:hypothetical protein